MSSAAMQLRIDMTPKPYGPGMVSDDLRKIAAAEAKKTGLRQLARETGIAASNLSRFLSGERPPSGRQVDALAARLGLRLVRAARRKKG